MLVFGPISSLFDFSTFLMMWYFFQPTISQFQTAWFIESLATQTFVIYIIRTRKIPFFQSAPAIWIFISTLGVLLVSWILPYSPFSKVLNFSPLSWPMMIGIAVLVISYLILTQIVKMFFYRYLVKKYN